MSRNGKKGVKGGKHPILKDEFQTVEMIKKMTRDDKIRLNQMVQSVLHHQQNNEMQEIFVTTEKRKLVQAESAMMQAQQTMIQSQIELQKVANKVEIAQKSAQLKKETSNKYQRLFKDLSRKYKTKRIEQQAQNNQQHEGQVEIKQYPVGGD